MKVISLINQKGGVAKTTSTYNLAAAKAKQDTTLRILMIDLDPQASLTISVGIEPGEEALNGHSTCDLFDTKKDPFDSIFHIESLEKKGISNLFIVPSDILLAETEIKLITKLYGAEGLLKKAIQKMEGYFDYVFIDCPPQLGRLTINALAASTNIIIPCQADYLPYRGLQSLMDTIEGVREINPNLSLDGIIVTLYEETVKDQKTIYEVLAEQYPLLGTVRKSQDIRRNTIAGLPVVISMPSVKTAAEYISISEKI